MKRLNRRLLAAAATLLAGALATTPAHAEEVGSIPVLEGPPRGFGLGLQLGEPSGLAWAVRTGGPSTVQGAVAWSLPYGMFHAHVDYVINLARLDSGGNLHVPFYVGGRARLRLVDDFGRWGDSAVGIGAGVPVGIAFVPQTTALDVYLQVTPGLTVLPAVGGFIDGSLGIRFYPF